MRHILFFAITLLFGTPFGLSQEPPPPVAPARGGAARTEEKKDAPPLAYLVMVQRAQEGSPDVAGHARGTALPGRKLAKQLEGIGFASCEVAAFSPQLTMDYLERFNVVVLGAGGEGNQHALFSPLADEKAKVLLDYVREGGGLLVLRNPGWQFGKDIEELNNWLRPTGIEILDEQVVDDDNRLALPSGWQLFWTGNIVGHPATKGVEGIFYPDVEGSYARYCDFTSPVKASKDWTVLISGTKTAQTTHRKKGGVLHPAAPGTYRSAPPILAVREFGKGRIAVLPVASTCLWQDGYHALWGDGLTMEGKVKGMKGDGARLMANLFAFLFEPSRGRFGGYAPKPEAEDARAARVKPIDWDAMQFGGVQRERCHVGLIGARSSLSSGQGSPEEFIRAAKEAGYGFLAFAERLEQLTPEEFASLKVLCRQHSEKTFKAYPGFTYLDDSGNTWVTFSDKLSWPQESWLSARHKGRIATNNPLIRGSGKPPVILTQSHRNPEAPWFQGNFNAVSLFTYENEKLIDESLDHWLRLLRESFGAAPVVVRFVDTPDQVRRARGSGFQTYVRWFDDNIVEALEGFTAMHKGRHVFLRTSFVSEGPIIEDLRIANAGTTDLAQIGADRCRLHLLVSAADGVNEVRILDGDRPHPWRRFLPNGTPSFEQTIDFFHDRQHDLVTVVTDRKGRRAVSWNNWTRVQENSFLRCSDNFNTMPRGKWWGEPEHLLNARGIENYLVVRNFMYCGAPRFAALDETARPAIEYYPVLACRFGSIVDTIVKDHYPLEATGNPDQTDVPFCAVKNERLAGKVRYTCYTCRQDSSLIERVEGDFQALKDFAGGENVIFRTTGRPDTLCVAAELSGGRFFSGMFTRTVRHFAGDLSAGGFAVLFPDPFNGSVGMIPLQDGLRYSSHTGEDLSHGNIYLRLPKEKAEFRQGEKIQYEYIGVNGPLGSSPDSNFVVDIIDSLGLRGKTAYAVEPSWGAVEGRSFALTLQAKEHAFRGKVSPASLPLDLPVRIGGLNPRWDAGILYKGETTLVVPEWVIDEFGQRYVVRRERKIENEILHFPVLEDGSGFLQIDAERGEKQVYIGNLLVSDNPDVCLMLTDVRPGKAAFVVHNPKDESITCHVRPGPGFDLLGEFSREVAVAGGSSVCVSLVGQ